MVNFNSHSEILECVMNISEGTNLSVVNLFGGLIRAAHGVRLLHLDPNPDANRTVITFAGFPKDIISVSLQLYHLAVEHIDMRSHAGEHPRLGAIDVCPLIPLQNISIDKAVAYSLELAEAVSDLGIPVFLYQYSHQNPKYRHLESIRKGGYEALAQKLQNSAWTPDYGPTQFNPRFGATVIGVRDLLIAYNISINTRSIDIARKIASTLRSSGSRSSLGLLKAVKAIGWYMPTYGCCQISMNLINHKLTSLHHVYTWTELISNSLDISILGSEIIGLVPEEAMVWAGQYASLHQCPGKQECIQEAIAFLKLGWSDFKIEEKVLEYVIFN